MVTAVGEGVDAAARRPHHVRDLVHRWATARSPRSAWPRPTVRSPCPRASPTPRRPGSGSRTSPAGSGSSTAVGIAGRRPAGRARRRRRQRDRRGPARPRARRARDRGRERRRASRRSAAELGADATLNHRDGPLAPALRELTDGRGVDLLYDPVGGALAEDAAGALARYGRLLAVGFASGRWPEIADPRPRRHEHVAGRRVRGRVLACGARRHPRQPRGASSRDGRLRNAVTGRGAVRRSCRRRSSAWPTVAWSASS